ncbi:MAG: iron donor protein CyaY [Betaproteobacteria bacterium]|nr:iron donor protein CyaY [Betaproteobacteria bacterium]
MTEAEFNERADAVFARIERALEACEDVEWELNQGILELELDSGSKIVVNRHLPNREIWVAAKSGGFHFGWKEGRWVSAREGAELFATLVRVIREQGGVGVDFAGER